MFGPLEGKRVLVTRAAEQSDDLSRRLTNLGAIPIELPTIRFVPPDDPTPLQNALQRLTDYDWLIFTSTNGVDFFFQAFSQAGKSIAELTNHRLAAIGPATAAALIDRGLQVEIVPDVHVAEGLLAAMPAVGGQRILLPTADLARSTLADGLRTSGATVDQVVAYQNRPAPPPPDLLELLPTIEVLTFTSASTVRNFLATLPDAAAQQAIQRAVVIVIGPKTAAAAIELGLTVHMTAADHTIPGLIEALLTYFTREKELRP
jgi:uroporphyrinogen-III synthase